MTDILVDLGANPNVRKLLKLTGVPLSLPQKLVRSSDLWFEQPLRDQSVFVSTARGSLCDTLAACLPASGATVWLHGTDSVPNSFADHGQAHARIPHLLTESTDEKPQALIFDATGLREPKELASMYSFFHQTTRSLRPCGRALVLCRPAAAIEDPVAAATQRAVEGFVRSLARELGRKGATANLISVATGAEERLAPRLALSAFTTIGLHQWSTASNQPRGKNRLWYQQPLSAKAASRKPNRLGDRSCARYRCSHRTGTGT